MTPTMPPMMTPVGSLLVSTANAPLVTLVTLLLTTAVPGGYGGGEGGGGEGEGGGGEGEGGGGEGEGGGGEGGNGALPGGYGGGEGGNGALPGGYGGGAGQVETEPYKAVRVVDQEQTVPPAT